MTPDRAVRPWGWTLLALAGLTALYAGPITTRFLNDDYLFLEQAHTQPLTRALAQLGALGNYYRPLSRQLYFALLTPISGGHPLVFHLVNYGLFLVSLALLADLLRAMLPLEGVVAGTLTFALLPLQRVILLWVSCSQDLLALTGVLAAFALYRRGRLAAALLPAAAALMSKESALPLPVVLAAWDLVIGRRRPAEAARRAFPFALLSSAWAVVALSMRSPQAAAPLHFDASSFAAAFAHLAQSLIGLEHPPGFPAALARHGPALVPLLALAPLALALPDWRPARAATAATPTTPASAASLAATPARSLGFAALWLAAFGAVVGPVAQSWSSYYYALAAVGGAVAVGTLMRRAGRLPRLGLIALLLWVHAGATATRAFAVVPRPWVWTSHLTSFYFERAAALTGWMSSEMVRNEPHPPADARFFFAALPPFAGFQMGNGALVRALYRSTTIESHFLSQFSDSTAGNHPCRFLYWNGERLVPLYGRGSDTFFQVGSDLLLLDHPDGAVAAFRRGLAAGESRPDHLYWLGWAELWRGHRDEAEAAWTRLGFADDSLRWIAYLRAAHNALTDGDTLGSRRHLIMAIRYGVGRPEAHAVLGELLAASHIKYALLETKVAAWLNPRDWEARRQLVRGLVRVRLDDAARRELEALDRVDPAWRGDPLVVEAARELEARAPAARDVAEF